MGFTPATVTRTRTSSGPGCGSGSSCGEPSSPSLSIAIARMMRGIPAKAALQTALEEPDRRRRPRRDDLVAGRENADRGRAELHRAVVLDGENDRLGVRGHQLAERTADPRGALANREVFEHELAVV